MELIRVHFSRYRISLNEEKAMLVNKDTLKGLFTKNAGTNDISKQMKLQSRILMDKAVFTSITSVKFYEIGPG